MGVFELEILLIACLVSIVCVLPGVFLVLRGIALMSDAISHAVLLGVVVMFLFIKTLNSFWLIMGASLAGVGAAALIEFFVLHKFVKKDSAISITFPFFFSLGVVLVTRYAHNVHLDLDMVMLGEIAFAPLRRFFIGGYDLGPYAVWLLLLVLSITLLVIALLFKELKLAVFDNAHAYLLGFSPVLLHYVLMILTSITVVVSFDIVGAVVVVALMVGPAASAYLTAHSIEGMILLSLAVGIVSACFGSLFAFFANVSIAGSIAVATGVLFFCIVFFHPINGIIARISQRNRLQHEIKKRLIVMTLQKYTNVEIDVLVSTLGWPRAYISRLVADLIKEGSIIAFDNVLVSNHVKKERE